MKIPAWLSLAARLVTTLLGIIITAAQSSPDQFGGAPIAGKIVFWGGLSVLMINGAFSCVGTGNQTSLSILGKVAIWFMAPLIVLSMLMPGSARADGVAKHRPLVVHRAGASKVGGTILQNPLQIVDQIRTWIANDAAQDLDIAIGLATKQSNKMTLACWVPIKGFVANVQALPTADKIPKVHLVTDIEILTELVQALQPGSDIITGCAALANYQKITAANMVTGIVTGAMGLAKFAPVIP